MWSLTLGIAGAEAWLAERVNESQPASARAAPPIDRRPACPAPSAALITPRCMPTRHATPFCAR